MVGNLYSRVDTPDWPEKLGKGNADKKVSKLIKDLDEASQNVWVPRQLFDLAVNREPGVKDLPKEKVLPVIQVHAPRPPHEAALVRVRELGPPLLGSITPGDLDAAVELLKDDRAYIHLIAEAVAIPFRDHLSPVALTDLIGGLEADSRVRDHTTAWTARLGEDFIKARGKKDYPAFLAIYSARPIVDGGLLAAIRDHASAVGVPAEHLDALIASTEEIAPTLPMQDCIRLLLQAAAAKNLANRLASRLDNDAGFRARSQCHSRRFSDSTIPTDHVSRRRKM